MTLSMRTVWLVIAIFVSGCQTSYTPVGEYGGFPHGGYSDTRINANTVIVKFDANIFTSQKDVNAYLMYRAAKITLDNGYDYFVIVSRSGQSTNVNIKTTTHQNDYITNPPKLRRTYYTSESYQSYSLSKTATQCIYPARCQKDPHAAAAVIKMFQGDIPPGLPNAYRADDVIAHVSPALAAPLF